MVESKGKIDVAVIRMPSSLVISIYEAKNNLKQWPFLISSDGGGSYKKIMS